jgi:DNA-binding transcriptional ArsR family regulator
MRPIATRRNALQYPLDDILGTEAHVRILRALIHEVDRPLGPSEVAVMTGLSQPGARKALSRLEGLGLLDSLGTARTQKYAPREADPIIGALRSLFEAEQRVFDDLLHGLRSVLRGVQEVWRAWLPAFPARLGEPLDVVVVVDVPAVPWVSAELRTRLLGLEQRLNQTLEVSLFTNADAPSPHRDAVFLVDAEPTEETRPRRRPRSHEESDAKSLVLAQAIADLLRADPSLTTRALRHLDRLAREPQGAAGAEIDEWRQLLRTYSPERLRRLLVSDNSRARRLRRSSPFLAVLSSDERNRLATLLSEDDR